MGSALGTHPRHPVSTQTHTRTQPTIQNTFVPLQTQTATPTDAMNVDPIAIVPLNAPTTHNTDLA
jgi:hypothetical protein